MTEFQKLLAIVGVFFLQRTWRLSTTLAYSAPSFRNSIAHYTVVGVQEEVPVMLSLVAFSNKTKHWFPEPAGAAGAQEKVAR